MLRDSFHETDRSTLTKFLPKWTGPFRIKNAHQKGWYNLEELDGTPFRSHTPGNRLKRFIQRTTVELRELQAENEELLEEGLPDQSQSESEGELPETSQKYGQDVPLQKQKVTVNEPRYPSRYPKPAQMNEEKQTRDAEEEVDLKRIQHKSRKAIAVVPKRSKNFDASEYRSYP